MRPFLSTLFRKKMAMRKRSWTAMAGTAYRGFRQASKFAKTARKMKSATQNRNSGPKTNTTQQDVVKMKPRKGISKKKLQKQKAFRNKITKALQPLATHHSYTEIMTAAITVTKNTASDPCREQYVNGLASQDLTIWAGTNNNAGVTRIKQAFHTLLSQSQLTDGAQFASPENERQMRILKATIDLSLSNVSSRGLVFDVYWCVATTTTNDVLHSTPLATWNQLLADNSNFGSLTDKAVSTDNGLTPDMAIGFGKYWKVLNKQRILIQANSTTEMRFEGGGRFYNPQKFLDQAIVAGFTKGILIVGGIGDNTGLINTNPVFRYHTTRTYRFMYPELKDQIPNRPTNTKIIF